VARGEVRFGSKAEELNLSKMSRLCPLKADIATGSSDFAFVPAAEVAFTPSKDFSASLIEHIRARIERIEPTRPRAGRGHTDLVQQYPE